MVGLETFRSISRSLGSFLMLSRTKRGPNADQTRTRILVVRHHLNRIRESRLPPVMMSCEAKTVQSTLVCVLISAQTGWSRSVDRKTDGCVQPLENAGQSVVQER